MANQLLEQPEIVEVPSVIVDSRDEVLGMVASRYGYALGRTAISKKKNADTKAERDAVSATAKLIRQKFEEYLKQGTDVRAEVKDFQYKYGNAKESYKMASEPYNKRIKPLSEKIKELDTAIPEKLIWLGFSVKPLEVIK